MSAPVFLTREYHGLLGPPGTQIPSPVDLLRLCTVEHPERYNMGLAYPPEAPVLWIKYGRSVLWNEVVAQAMAHKELRGLQSQVKAPAVVYACEMELPRRNGFEVNYCNRSYVVMEYIPGKTAGEWLKGIGDPARKDLIYSRIAFALSELHRHPGYIADVFFSGSPSRNGNIASKASRASL